MTADTPAPAEAGTVHTDVVVVGAGPVALFQVFQLGLQGLKAELVDVLPHLGGQCAELYPDKPIYDIPGLPVVGGRELVDRLAQQMAPFAPGRHLGQLVTALQTLPDDQGFLLSTEHGTRLRARAVVLAAGAGAFLPRPLRLPELEALSGGALRHHAPLPEARAAELDALTGRHVVVTGDEDPALDWAATLADDGRCASVTLLHRQDRFRAGPEALARVAAARAAGRLAFVAGQPAGAAIDGHSLQALDIVDADDHHHRLPCDRLYALLGLSPKLGPLADWHLALARRHVVVDPATLQTSQPGIHAVGDIATYPGKLKLLLCGFHEATLAAFAIAQRLAPDQRVLLQYTTTSALLQARLGVAPA